jgi:hypothetical protein
MFQPSEFFKALPHVLATIGIVAAAVVGIFIAWWIAVTIVIVLLVWFGVRRLFLMHADRPAGAEVIEGEFEEVEEPPERLR